MKVTTIGLDIAKSVFQIHGVDQAGNIALQRKLRRSEVIPFFSKLEPCLVGIEACHSSHFWGRELLAMGHDVRLIPTQYVKPFVLGGKNDANDAAAICVAVTRPGIHFVPVKSAQQQAIQSLHRMRQRLIHERTAKSNQIRSMFAEEGVIFAVGMIRLRQGIVALVHDAEARITPVLKQLGSMYLDQMDALGKWLSDIDHQLATIFDSTPACRQLALIPGIGPVIATAMVGTTGDPTQFKNGRQFAAWLGLTPRQRSSGGKTQLGRITKRGDTYLRTLLVQGACAVMRFIARHDDRHSRWIKSLMQRRHKNIAAIALANKTARIAWAVLTHHTSYRVIP